MFLGKGRNPREMIGSANGIKKFNFLKKPVISITSKLEIFEKIVEYLRIVKKDFCKDLWNIYALPIGISLHV